MRLFEIKSRKSQDFNPNLPDWVLRLAFLAFSLFLVVVGTLTIVVTDWAIDLPGFGFSNTDGFVDLVDKIALLVMVTLYCSTMISGAIIFGFTLVLLTLTFVAWIAALLKPTRITFLVSSSLITTVFLNGIIQALLNDYGILRWCGF